MEEEVGGMERKKERKTETQSGATAKIRSSYEEALLLQTLEESNGH